MASTTGNFDYGFATEQDEDTAVIARSQVFEGTDIAAAENSSNQTSIISLIGDLNADVFVHVLSHLPSVDVPRCSRVNKAWRDCIFATFSLWKSLAITKRTTLPGAKISFWSMRLPAANKSLRELALEGDTDASCLAGLAKEGMTEKLEVLRGTGLKNFTGFWRFSRDSCSSLRNLTIRFDRHFTFNYGLASMLPSLPHLEELEIVGFCALVLNRDRQGWMSSTAPLVHNKLRRLRLENIVVGTTSPPRMWRPRPLPQSDNLFVQPRQVSLPALEELVLKQCPPASSNLQHLPALIDWSQLPKLRSLHAEFHGSYNHLVCFELSRIFEFPSLEALAICEHPDSSRQMDNTTTGSIWAPQLRRLELFGPNSTKTAAFLTINAPAYPFLETLVVHDPKLWSASDRLDTIFESMPQLKHLRVSGTGFLDAGLQALIDHAVELVSLDVSDCEEITGEALVRLVQTRANSPGGGSGLRELAMVGCRRVGPESAAWIKEEVETVTGPEQGDAPLLVQ